MPKIRHHRSSRRVPPPRDSDFDHEINLVDRDEDENSLRPSSAGPSSSQHDTLLPNATEGPADGERGRDTEARRDEGPEHPSVRVEGAWMTPPSLLGSRTALTYIRAHTTGRGWPSQVRDAENTRQQQAKVAPVGHRHPVRKPARRVPLRHRALFLEGPR
jgi:hypothetical protein